MNDNWLTTNQAAKLSGYHVNYIRQLVRAKKLIARKFGPVWQVSEQSLFDYLAQADQVDDKRHGPK